MAKHVRWYVPALVGALTLLFAGPARADGDLILVLQTAPDLSQAEVVETLTAALKQISPTGRLDTVIKGEPVARQISAVEYAFYSSVIKEKDDAPPPALPVRNGELELRQLLAAEPSWQIKYIKGKEPAVLNYIKLTDKDGKVTELTPAKDSTVLEQTSVGSYTLQLPKGLVPKTYELEFETVDGKKPPFKGDWPTGDNYFLIRLKDFRGDRTALENTMKDNTKVANNLETLDLKSNVTLAVGRAEGAQNEPSGEDLRENKLVVTVPNLQRGKPARVWMLFPLTKEQADKELKNYAGLTGEQVSKKIRETKPATAMKAIAPINTPMDPVWIELPFIDKPQAVEGLRAEMFGRVLPLVAADKAGVKPGDYARLLKDIPAAQRLLVYEFDDGKTQSAIRYGPKGDQKYVRNSELGRWAALLTEAAGGSAPPP